MLLSLFHLQEILDEADRVLTLDGPQLLFTNQLCALVHWEFLCNKQLQRKLPDAFPLSRNWVWPRETSL